MNPPPAPDSWQPPSAHLELRDGLWQVGAVSAVSYPAAGNAVCFQVEDDSFWFRHRMDCIHSLIRQFPPGGTLYDIGGGNGYVAAALQAAGTDVALIEPGPGARNAQRRGVRKVINATMEDARLEPNSLPSAGAFDVVEHIADDAAFLRSIQERLVPGGRFFCTVPALPALWSDDDVHAGHYRRYTRRSLCTALARAGFTVEFASYFFVWLILPVLGLRAVPSRLHLKDKRVVGSATAIRSEHRLPALLAGLVDYTQEWELDRLRARRPLPVGNSLLCVARANRS